MISYNKGKLLSLVALFLLPLQSESQSLPYNIQDQKIAAGCEIPVDFVNLNIPIPDGSLTGVTNSQTVSGVSGTNLGVDIRLTGVCFEIFHTWVGDLTVKIISPSGTQVTLMERPGFPASLIGCDGDDVDVCVQRGSMNPMENTCGNLPAISGSFTAHIGNDLDDINIAGGNPNGIWQLFVNDVSIADTGSIRNWSLIFNNGPIASWSAPDSICATSGPINLNSLINGTSGGTWSGTGVSGSTFNPAGLSGPTSITYVVTDLTSGCSDSSSQSIYVVPEPQPSFTFSYLSPTLISFTNTSTNASSYLWSFGDNTTSTLLNPTHNYSQSGTYNVSLSATNICGTFSFSQPIVIQTSGISEISDGSFAPIIYFDSQSGELIIQSPGLKSGDYELQIINSTGQLLYTTSFVIQAIADSYKFHCSIKSSGIYFVQLRSKAGIFSKKTVFLVD